MSALRERERKRKREKEREREREIGGKRRKKPMVAE